MENKINVAELLKYCPKGMELDCPMYNKVTLYSVDNNKNIIFPIRILREDGNSITLTKYGQITDADFAKCVIFPKGKTTWEGFQKPFKDGDIVTWEDRGSLVAFIYKERKDVAVVKHHFALYTGSLGTVTDGEISLVENEIVFATEEEKQKLFDAIKANGYHWNSETKTLEKFSRFKIGDKIKKKGLNTTKYLEIVYITPNIYIFRNGSFQYNKIIDKDYELISSKFDITTLVPFESKVLVRECKKDVWQPTFYGFFHQPNKRFYTTSNTWLMCIPYNKDTKHLVGTTNDCDDFYKTWEK